MKRLQNLICPLAAVITLSLSTNSWPTMSDASQPVLTLQDTLLIAQKDNPEILAAKKKWEAVQATISQSWTPEKPRVDIERMYAPRGKNIVSDAVEKNIAVTQELPFPTTLYLKSRWAKKEAARAEMEFQRKEQDVLARVKTTYALLYMSRHALHVFEENTDLMTQFSKVAEAKYAAGKASQGDVLKAQVELSKMQNMLITLEQEKETNQAMLNTLLNRDPQSPVGTPEEPEMISLKDDVQSLQSLALHKRPDLQNAALAFDQSQTSVGLARSSYLPDLMLQYRRRDMLNGPGSQDAIVGFSVPLWFWKQGAMVNEAKADREAAQAEYRTMETTTLYDVKNLFVKTKTAERLIELYRTSVIPQAEEALKVAEAGYQAEKLNFLDLLDSSRTLLELRLEHYQHLSDYQVDLAELEQAVGVDLREAR